MKTEHNLVLFEELGLHILLTFISAQKDIFLEKGFRYSQSH